jgi:hypothetical protein
MMRWGAFLGLLLVAGAAMGRDEKPDEGFRTLFNGKDLTGWYYRGSKEDLAGKTSTADERVQVKDGAIVMMEKDKNGKGGIKDLYTKEMFGKSFHLKLEFRAGLKADSGVYVRGPQLQVRDYKRRKERPQLKKFKDDDWNTLDIIVRDGVTTTSVNGRQLTDKDTLELKAAGGKVTATLNGKEVDVKAVQVRKGAVAECLCNGEPLEVMTNIPANGGIGLQAETGKFEFRNVRVKVLK